MYSFDDEDNQRIFNPRQQIRANLSKKITQPSDILHHEVESGTRKLIMYAFVAPDTPRVESNSLVVAIDGACRGNGQPGAVASYGVYFAPDSSLNSYGNLPPPSSDSGAHTNQKAELHALSRALDTVEQKFGDNFTISRLLIITDSTYLVDGLTKHVWDWEYKGYKNAKGKNVVNGEAFRELHGRIGKLEEDGMDVCFWAVERGWNTEADRLANAALEGQ